MSVVRRLLAAWWLCTLLLTPAAWAASGKDSDTNPFDGVGRAYLVEIDGAVVWRKAEHTPLAPASLTKLMTALIVAEQVREDERVTVSAAAARETGTTLYLKAGTVFSAQSLLAATLIASANDACRALADHVAGDQTRFVQRMNQRAATMGLRHTRFANACGHDAPGHYASVEDLRQLGHAVMAKPQLAALVGQGEAAIASMDGQQRFTLTSTNALIGRYNGTVGVKTGTTPQAGKCLIALVRRGSHTVMLVLLQGKDRWWDTVDVLDIAFARADAAQ